jgi:hypothetical protein
MGSTEVREGSGEAVVDIAAWLRRLGLEQYEQAFRDNNIDAEVERCSGRRPPDRVVLGLPAPGRA